MKISKLFHWLYAFLMFLPIFFVLGKGLYVTFNKNAKESYYGETINEYNYISTPLQNLKSGDYVYISASNYTNPNQYRQNINIAPKDNTILYEQNTLTNIVNVQIYVQNSDRNCYVNLTDINNNRTYISLIDHAFTCYLEINTITYTNTDILTDIYSVKTYNNYSYLDNAIDYGMYQLNESNLFAWAKDSFLSSPITYITNLFNMPSDSPIITALSYWLNVSIVWLTFDLIMYVPLLAHRWIDKGVIE